MSKDTMFVRLDGEPFKSRAMDFRRERIAASKVWHAFREKVGALAIGPPRCFRFATRPDKALWIKAGNRRTEWYCPRKGTDLERDVAALPSLPETWGIFGDAIMTDYSYECPDGSRVCGGIGFFVNGPTVGWHEDVFICGIPDPAPTIKSIRENHPDAKFTNGCDTWTLPAGLTRMTEAEVDLFFAQARVEAERNAA